MRNGDLFRKIVLLAVTLALFLTSCGGQAGETTVGDGDAVVDAPVEVIATGNETDEDENLAEELSSAAEEPVGLGGPIVIDTYHLSPFDVDEARFGECLAAEINATMGPLGKARLDQIAQPVRDNVVEAMTLDSEISDIDALDMFAEQIVGCFSKEELTIRLGELRTAGPSGSEDCIIEALDGEVEATRWVAHAQGKQFSPIGDVQSRRGLADANWDAVFESETSMEEMVASCLPSGDLGTALAAAYDPPFDSCLTNELSAVFTPDELNQVGHGDRGVFPGSPDLVWNSEDSTVLPRFTHAMANCFTDEQLFGSLAPGSDYACLREAAQSFDYALVPFVWGTKTGGEPLTDPRLEQGIVEYAQIAPQCAVAGQGSTTREQFEMMLADDELRPTIVESFAAAWNMDPAEVECLVDNLDVWAVSEIGAGRMEITEELANEIQAGLDRCGLSFEDIG